MNLCLYGLFVDFMFVWIQVLCCGLKYEFCYCMNFLLFFCIFFKFLLL
jgi:hypothetical protein